jgi:hypothetical protein
MAQVQITDVVVPAEFTAYQVENSMVSTALFQSGVVLPNGEMQAQLQAGAQQFTVPFWSDIPDIVWTVRSGRLPGEPTGYPPKKGQSSRMRLFQHVANLDGGPFVE